MSDNAHLQLARDKLIFYPRFQRILDQIEDLHHTTQILGEVRCLAYEGPQGVGKSSIARYYTQKHPRKLVGNHTEVPVLYVTVPKLITIPNMITEMLSALGDPLAAWGNSTSKHKTRYPGNTPWTRNYRLREFIKNDCQVKLIIIDEFQHMIRFSTQRVMADVTDWLKDLIKQTNVPVVVVGIQPEIERIIRSNAQLNSLFTIETLEPFQFDTKRPETIQEFGNFIRRWEGLIGKNLPWKSDTDVDLLYRIYYATNGITRHIKELLILSADLANKARADIIEMKFLKEIFNRELRRRLEKQYNPFDTKWEKRFAPPDL